MSEIRERDSRMESENEDGEREAMLFFEKRNYRRHVGLGLYMLKASMSIALRR